MSEYYRGSIFKDSHTSKKIRKDPGIPQLVS
jgi:hypothetical protein